MNSTLVICLLLFYAAFIQADDAPTQLTAFSSTRPGTAMPANWALKTVPHVSRATQFDLIDDGGKTVLRAVSLGASASLVHKTHADPTATPWLAWRWKISRTLETSDLGSQEGDDFSARIYVLFDFPLEKLAVADQMKISMGQLLYDENLPAAALCYVWDNRHLVGFSTWSAYSDRVRMFVVESGTEHVGQWRQEQRNLAADFKAAFGEEAPPILGVVLAADTDNTGENVTSWFGDVTLRPKPVTAKLP
jgi:hypothetical protein